MVGARLVRAAALGIGWAAAAAAAEPSAPPDPDAFDPVLDGVDPAPPSPSERYRPPDPRSPGFTVGGGVGLYLGAVRSHLTKEESGLEPGTRPGVAVSLGYRTRGPFELGLDTMLGLGLTYDPSIDDDVFAFDLLFEPRLLVHVLEADRWSLYAGAAGSAWLFDVEGGVINQGGVGPGGLAGLLRRFDRHSLVFVEAGATALYDFLAYRRTEPTPEERAADPAARPHREDGAWFVVGRVMVGYRLTGF